MGSIRVRRTCRAVIQARSKTVAQDSQSHRLRMPHPRCINSISTRHRQYCLLKDTHTSRHPPSQRIPSITGSIILNLTVWLQRPCTLNMVCRSNKRQQWLQRPPLGKVHITCHKPPRLMEYEILHAQWPQSKTSEGLGPRNRSQIRCHPYPLKFRCTKTIDYRKTTSATVSVAHTRRAHKR